MSVPCVQYADSISRAAVFDSGCLCFLSLWCGMLRPTVLRISAGSQSISFGRCRLRCVCLLMGVVSPRCVFFCGMNAVLIGCTWIIWWHFLFLSRSMCKWSISFSVVVDRCLCFCFCFWGIGCFMMVFALHLLLCSVFVVPLRSFLLLLLRILGTCRVRRYALLYAPLCLIECASCMLHVWYVSVCLRCVEMPRKLMELCGSIFCGKRYGGLLLAAFGQCSVYVCSLWAHDIHSFRRYWLYGTS